MVRPADLHSQLGPVDRWTLEATTSDSKPASTLYYNGAQFVVVDKKELGFFKRLYLYVSGYYVPDLKKTIGHVSKLIGGLEVPKGTKLSNEQSERILSTLRRLGNLVRGVHLVRWLRPDELTNVEASSTTIIFREQEKIVAAFEREVTPYKKLSRDKKALIDKLSSCYRAAAGKFVRSFAVPKSLREDDGRGSDLAAGNN